MRLFGLAKDRLNYSALGKKPKAWHLPILLTAALLRSVRHLNFDSSQFLSSLRLWTANRYPEVNILEGSKPKIELLSVAAPKDFESLLFSIKSAIKYSGNEIEQVTIITTENGFEECINLAKNLCIKTNVINENTLISLDDREKIRAKFNGRYGWVIQQLLAVQYISTSQSPGILLLNSDTILLRKMDFLNKNKNQILMVSTEFHSPYYKLLNKLIGTPVNPKCTFITHHMLFQPWVLREIILKHKIVNVSNLISWLIMNVEPDQESPLCVEFELYGQGMLELHPELVKLRKFSNVSIPRTSRGIEESLEVNTILKVKQFNSCSFHEYNYLI